MLFLVALYFLSKISTRIINEHASLRKQILSSKNSLSTIPTSWNFRAAPRFTTPVSERLLLAPNSHDPRNTNHVTHRKRPPSTVISTPFNPTPAPLMLKGKTPGITEPLKVKMDKVHRRISVIASSLTKMLRGKGVVGICPIDLTTFCN